MNFISDEKADEIPLQTQPGQEKKEQDHIQGVGKNVVADTPGLLSQPFGHAVGDDIAV